MWQAVIFRVNATIRFGNSVQIHELAAYQRGSEALSPAAERVERASQPLNRSLEANAEIAT